MHFPGRTGGNRARRPASPGAAQPRRTGCAAARPSPMLAIATRHAPPRQDHCICGKHMLEADNENVCLWCGHGSIRPVSEHAYRRNMIFNAGPRAASPRDAPVVAIAAARRHTWDEDACASAAHAWELAHGRFPRATDWTRPLARGEHRPSTGTIYNHFGSWGAFKNYCADIPRPQARAA